MAIYGTSDLHLSIGTANKEMDIFGEHWENHAQKIKENWEKTVAQEDTVVIAGDICWATGTANSRLDLRFINELPGRKIILKGNHDYWWDTVTKLNKFAEECGFGTLRFLHNDAAIVEDKIICGTRGWMLAEGGTSAAEDIKIFEREKLRLDFSLQKATKIVGTTAPGRPQKNNTVPHVSGDDTRTVPPEIIVFMHYPPVNKNSGGSAPGGNTEFIDIMKSYGVKRCYYGHIHSNGRKIAIEGDFAGVNLKLISTDCTDFTPILVKN